MILAGLRLVVLFFYLIFIFIFSILFSILFCFDHSKSHIYCRLFAGATKIIGLKVEIRGVVDNRPPTVFVCNHQNNYDMLTVTHIVPGGCVSVGKSSLVLIPFFGLIYWFSGNILINRSNKLSSLKKLSEVASNLKAKSMSLWFFPEGTRTRGRGIMPFKLGAFHTAMQARVPIVPVVVSSQDHIRLSNLDNGKVIIQVLPEIPAASISDNNIKDLANSTRDLILESYNQLNKELSTKD